MFYNHFRKCSLKLEEEEINDQNNIYDVIKFRKKLETAYDSVDDYLERQFHILREDCFYYLKHAIIKIRRDGIRNVANLPKDCNLWRYKNVKISDISIGLFDIAYQINFETIGKVDWADSKQLRFGSLLCLSYDNFRSYFLATVSDSSMDDLKEGSVKIHFIDFPLINRVKQERNYQMLETQAYYESYVHVLSRLQTLTDSSFPFVNQFLNKSLYNNMIKYLRYKSPDISSRHHMDHSQKDAFQMALTKSISVIQGPPGTGKTTVGFWIIEKILNKYKSLYGLHEPILVICYTNHALDQFLEKIQEICTHGDVIRIGSKSDSDKLKSCNITEFVNEWKTEKKYPKYMAVRRAKLREELNQLKFRLLDEDTNDTSKRSDALQYERLLSEFRKCGMEEHLMVMRTAKVVGMTTTACARYANVLMDLGCKVVIIEEAAEVLEAHVICSLNSNCEQLIMIGDHQQLQPTAAVEDFENVFDLNVSLFERLIRNGFKHVTLTTQRRMRPEISRCIAPIYPDLTDHHSVKEYPDVVGMRTNMYMYNHCYLESSMFETSYKNSFEVTFVKGLCDFLLKQRNCGEKITVITTYRGQKYCIEQALRNEKYKGIGVFVVDGYQGEENDIIILSLVRSNFEGKIGFLKKPNRICVALSRAKHGFYVVGNMTCLKARSGLWTQISNIIGPNQGLKIPVACLRNSNHRPIVEEVVDFTDDNLCKDKCWMQFTCGVHVCEKTCHAGPHNNCMAIVEKRCQRMQHLKSVACSERLDCVIIIISMLSCGHRLRHACKNVTVKCTETVELLLPCQHKQNAVCGTEPKEVVCSKRYSQTLDCGHVYVDCNKYVKPCERPVKYLRKCDHSKTIKCFQRPIEDKLECQEQVSVKLACSHTQSVLCGTDVAVVQCNRRTKQTLKCGHVYVDCVAFVGSCYRNVVLERPCGHTVSLKCHARIQEEKKACRENIIVVLKCGHEQTAVCGTKPTDVTCLERYSQELICGHQIIDCLPYSGACHTFVRQKLACGHVKKMECVNKNTDKECVEICSGMLGCGHICSSSCVNCFSGRLHVPCQVVCGKKLFCGDLCKDKCHFGDCNGCRKDCLLTSMKRLFRPTIGVKYSLQRWIELSQSVHKRAMDTIFPNIIQHLQKVKGLSEREQKNLTLAFVCYGKVVSLANEIFNENEFNDELVDYIGYVERVVHRLYLWLNPFQREITNDCVDQLDMELSRLKDLFSICLHIQVNNGSEEIKALLDEIKEAVYSSETRTQLRMKISYQM